MNRSVMQDVQGTLNQNNIKDVKFLFKPIAFGSPMTDLEEDLADVLSKFYAGKKTVCEKLPSEDLSVGC